jgi:hypothetical protein
MTMSEEVVDRDVEIIFAPIEMFAHLCESHEQRDIDSPAELIHCG